MIKGDKKRHPTVRMEPVDDSPERTAPGGDAEILADLWALSDLGALHARLAPALQDDDLRRARAILEEVIGALRRGDPEPLRRAATALAERSSEPGAHPEPASVSPWVRPWGQAYAPGSVPGAAVASRPHASPSAYERPYDAVAEGTQLMRYDAIDDALTQESLAPLEGYDPPPPSEPTHPHQSSEPGSSPTPPRATELIPDSARTPARRPPSEEDSATNQLSFTSQAHALALSIEEYAAFCAERDHAPATLRAIARRYDLFDGATVTTVDRAFELRLARDPALRTRWQRAYDSFANSLRQGT